MGRGSAAFHGKALADPARVPASSARGGVTEVRFMALPVALPSPNRGSAPAPRSLHGDASLLGLIDRVKAGDRAALDALTRLIRPHVERQLARYPVSDDDRLDLVQSTLLQ